MIQESVLLMTVTDMFIVGISVCLLLLLTNHYRKLEKPGLRTGINLILFGTFVIVAFYSTDLALMYLLPVFNPGQLSISVTDFYLNWSWMATVSGTGTIISGIFLLLQILFHHPNHPISKLETVLNGEEKFKKVFQNAAIGYAMVSSEHRMIEVNKTFCDMLGYKREELINVKFMEITYPEDVAKSIENHLRLFNGENNTYQIEKRYLHKNGHIICALLNVTIVLDEGTKPLYAIAQIQDITETRQLTERLSYQASHDTLTDLINRQEFENRLASVLETTRKNRSEHVLCYLDLDQFKVINDTCGHVSGDELLCMISRIMLKKIRKRDTLARLGGDEFGILMEHCNIEQARRVADTLQKEINEIRFFCCNKSFNIGVSMGLVSINEFSGSSTDILREADIACFMAKDTGRNRIHVYYPEDKEMAQRHGEMQWVARINQTLEEERFRLYIQPIIPLGQDDPELPHYEILLRIEEEGELILPGVFLPAAERYNLITKIDRWVIETIFTAMVTYPSVVTQLNFCSINISGQSLTNPEFLDFIISQIQEKNINTKKLCFEITETAAISNLGAASRFISTLKELGCRFALDDFGSGLSSFAYLKNLNVDYLKIDGIFVKDIVNNDVDFAMVKMINELGHVMGMQTIAEFVENQSILDKLGEIGVDNAQGYGVGIPQPLSDIFYNKLVKANNINL